MSQKRKNFIVRNEPFTCAQCGFKNEELKGSCRNHCRKCLYSLHVDEDVPGDRQSNCRGLMKAISLEQSSKKGQMLVHECLTCGKKMRNMVALDDDMEVIIELSIKPMSP